MDFSNFSPILSRVVAIVLVILLSFTVGSSEVLASASVDKLQTLQEVLPTPTPSPLPIIPYSSAGEKLLSPIQTIPSPLAKAIEDLSNSCKFTQNTWIGKASFYTSEGCLGCNNERQMANGEILDDKQPTIAFMRAPLNSVVEVKNLNTNKSVIARVTDTGGFESLGRIADVSYKVKESIGLKTDESQVQVKLLECG